MPIKPENLKRYPKCWPAIRAAVQARAGDKCEGCGVDNHSRRVLFRDDGTEGSLTEVARIMKIVCTTAHFDHQPEHNDGFEKTGFVKPLAKSNLRFWCQRCHNRHDRKHRGVNAAATRDRKRGQGRIF